VLPGEEPLYVVSTAGKNAVGFYNAEQLGPIPEVRHMVEWEKWRDPPRAASPVRQILLERARLANGFESRQWLVADGQARTVRRAKRGEMLRVHLPGKAGVVAFYNGDQLLASRDHCDSFGAVFGPLDDATLRAVALERGFAGTTWVLASVAARLGLCGAGAAPSATLGSGAAYFNVAELAEGHVVPAAVTPLAVSQLERNGLDAVRTWRDFPSGAEGFWHRADQLLGSQVKPAEGAVVPSECHGTAYFHEAQLERLQRVHRMSGTTPFAERFQRLLEHTAQSNGFTSMAWFPASRAELCGAVSAGEQPAVTLGSPTRETRWYNGEQLLPAPPVLHTMTSGQPFDADHQVALERTHRQQGYQSRAWSIDTPKRVKKGETAKLELMFSATNPPGKMYNGDQLVGR
jgi:hypothetical protein